MKRCMSKKYLTYAFIFLMVIIICITWYKPIVVKKDSNRVNSVSSFLNNLREQEWYKINCFDGRVHNSVGKLTQNLESWSQAFERRCQILWSKFQKIYSVEIRKGQLEFPKDFEMKLKSWFTDTGSLNEMKLQTVIHVRNEYTKEHTVYNPIRSKRPLQLPLEDPLEYVNKLSSSTEKSCDFCNYEKMTSKDTFDRIEGKYSVTAANAFKLDKWHGLMLTRKHNPSEINEEDLVDLFNTTLMWFKTVHSIEENSKFPNLLWDSLLHAGASQVHPHVHALLHPERYYGILEEQHRAAVEYYETTGNNYWEDIIEIHHALGLSVRFGNAVALTPLTSRKDNEVLLLSDSPSLDLFRLLYYVIQTYYKKFRIYCFSSGMALPVINGKQVGSLPAFIRIATRGDCSSVRSDISSLELYAAYNVNVDVYKVISNLTDTVHDLSTKSMLQWKEMLQWIP